MAGVQTKAFTTIYPGYRLVTREDLVDGAEFVQVDTNVQHDVTVDPKYFGTTIKLDESAIDGDAVYYHCIKPADDIQCFSGIRDFLDPDANDYVVLAPEKPWP